MKTAAKEKIQPFDPSEGQSDKKVTDPIFADDSQMEILRNYAVKIIELRNEAKRSVDLGINIDLLDTDKIKSIVSITTIKKYDPDYQSNMRRNGADGVSGTDKVEIKNTTKEKAKIPLKSGLNKGKIRNVTWQFHAFHNDDYTRMILNVWAKENLALIRIYDIKKPENIKTIKNHLDTQSKIFEEKVRQEGKKATRDVIELPEELVAKCKNLSSVNIDGVSVFKDW